MSESTEETVAVLQPKFKVGDYVFARYPRYPPWPARIVDVTDNAKSSKKGSETESKKKGPKPKSKANTSASNADKPDKAPFRYTVYFYGENTYESNIAEGCILPYNQFKGIYGASNTNSMKRQYFLEGIRLIEIEMAAEGHVSSAEATEAQPAQHEAQPTTPALKQASDATETNSTPSGERENSDPKSSDASPIKSQSTTVTTSKTDALNAAHEHEPAPMDVTNSEKQVNVDNVSQTVTKAESKGDESVSAPGRRRSQRTLAQSKRLNSDFIIEGVRISPRRPEPATTSAIVDGGRADDNVEVKTDVDACVSQTQTQMPAELHGDQTKPAATERGLRKRTRVAEVRDSNCPTAKRKRGSARFVAAETSGDGPPEPHVGGQKQVQTQADESTVKSRLRTRTRQSSATSVSKPTDMIVDVPKLELVFLKGQDDKPQSDSAAAQSTAATESDVQCRVNSDAQAASDPTVAKKIEEESSVAPVSELQTKISAAASAPTTEEKTVQQQEDAQPDKEKKSALLQSPSPASPKLNTSVPTKSELSGEGTHTHGEQPAANEKKKKKRANEWLFEEKRTLKPKRVVQADATEKPSKSKTDFAEKSRRDSDAAVKSSRSETVSGSSKRETIDRHMSGSSDKAKVEQDRPSSIEAELRTQEVRLRNAMQDDDADGCVSIIKKLARLSVTRSVLHASSDLIHTIKRCRKNAANERVRDCAYVLFAAWCTLTCDTLDSSERESPKSLQKSSSSKAASKNDTNTHTNANKNRPASKTHSAPSKNSLAGTVKVEDAAAAKRPTSRSNSATAAHKDSEPSLKISDKTTGPPKATSGRPSVGTAPVGSTASAGIARRTGFTKPGSLNVSVSVSLPPPISTTLQKPPPPSTADEVTITRVTKTSTFANSLALHANSNHVNARKSPPRTSATPVIATPANADRSRSARPPTPVIPLSSDSETSPPASPRKSHAPADALTVTTCTTVSTAAPADASESRSPVEKLTESVSRNGPEAEQASVPTANCTSPSTGGESHSQVDATSKEVVAPDSAVDTVPVNGTQEMQVDEAPPIDSCV